VLHYAVLLMLAIGGLIALLLVRRFPWLGWFAVSLLVLSAYDWSGYTELAVVGGLAVYPADVTAVVLLGAIILTPGALGRLRPAEIWIWGTLLAVLLLSLVRGMSAHGMGVAGNEFRGLFQLIAVTTWAWGRMRLPGFDKSLYRWSLFTGLGLSAVMLWHITQRGLGQVDQVIIVGGQTVTTRPLIAGQALILGLVGLALLVGEQAAWRRVLGVAFLALTVLCQHRTVWVSLLAAAVVLVLAAPRARHKILPLAFVGGVFLLVAYAAGLLDPLIAKFSLAYHSRGTLDDRMAAFQTLIDQQNQQGTTSVLLGQPFGGGYARLASNGKIETFAPHDFYVLLYLRIGLVGAGLFVVALVRGLWISFTRHDVRAIGWSATIMTFCLAYNLPFYAGICLAVALTAARLEGAPGDPSRGEHPEPVPAVAA
jgi:hypothetical protein